jgi:hypothetical protein
MQYLQRGRSSLRGVYSDAKAGHLVRFRAGRGGLGRADARPVRSSCNSHQSGSIAGSAHRKYPRARWRADRKRQDQAGWPAFAGAGRRAGRNKIIDLGSATLLPGEAASSDPQAKDGLGNCLRVDRGSSWMFPAWLLRSATRERNPADYRDVLMGFRVARTLP